MVMGKQPHELLVNFINSPKFYCLVVATFLLKEVSPSFECLHNYESVYLFLQDLVLILTLGLVSSLNNPLNIEMIFFSENVTFRC
jgi:uncharacterized protein YerC